MSISELLPDLPLKQIAAAVKRANGDQEQAVLLLLNEPELTSPQQPSTPTITTTTTTDNTNSTAAAAPDQERAEQTGRRRRKSDEEEEEAMRMAQDESLALRLQQEDEEASLQAALRELELQERGGGEQQRNAEQEEKEKEKEKEEEREEGENRTRAEPIADKHEGDRYDCQICMEEYPYHEVFLIQGCGHGFCADCMTSYLTIKIKERSIAAPPDPIAPSDIGYESDILKPPRPAATAQAAPTAALSGDDVYGIRCPAFKCTHVLGYWDIQHCVSAELLNEFDTFILNKALDHIPNMTWCPKGCGGGVEANDADAKFIQCVNPLCRFTFCKTCRSGHKPKTTCETAAERRRLKREPVVRPGRGLTKEEKQDLNKWARKKDVRHCPRCWTLIEKNLGCNHMHCIKCRQPFLWSDAPLYTRSRLNQVAQGKRP